MGQRNDQVFQLSLTEIAFTIVFILLLLLGYLVFKEQAERKEAEEALKKVQGLEKATVALEKAKGDLGVALRAGGSANPDEVIKTMLQAEDVKAERDRLKREVEDLDEKLRALTALQDAVNAAGDGSKEDGVSSEVGRALVLQNKLRRAMQEAQAVAQAASSPESASSSSVPASKRAVASSTVADRRASAASASPTQASQAKRPSVAAAQPALPITAQAREKLDRDIANKVPQALKTQATLVQEARRQLGINVEPGGEEEAIKDFVRVVKEYGGAGKGGRGMDSIQKENTDLRGQVAFLKNRLDARGGRDWPPCWADEQGNIQFLFNVDLRPDSVTVTAAWPPTREEDAKTLPGIAELMANPLTFQEFRARVQPVFDWSKRHDPQCRHYVFLRNSIPDATSSDRARLMVEDFFYKSEVRR